MVVPTWDIFPQRFFIPDLIGVRDDKVFVVEVETKRDELFEVIGKSMIWKIMATFVCIAYPAEQCEELKRASKIFERLACDYLACLKKK